MLIKIRIFSLLFLLMLAQACSSQKSPLISIQARLDKYPEYSIILQDQKEEGIFSKTYFHQYKIILGERTKEGDDLIFTNQTTDWTRVSKREYRQYFEYLGMVIASKSAESGVANNQHPPGYQYVGNQRYGRWSNDGRGSFWEFYGKYAMMNQMFNLIGGRRVYRNDWNSYRDYSSSGRPYFGRNREYGTSGSHTAKTNPNFFQRKKMRATASKTRFSDKVKGRVGRSSMGGVRGRSGGFGK
jgi:hypothetical protein